jgi:16S rRNA (cytidine1402-2'-O)-methyltransferase
MLTLHGVKKSLILRLMSNATLYIVSTPIGNREDITLRALRILKEVDFVCCEDTRHSGMLLKHYEIEQELKSFHSHSSDAKVEAIVRRLTDGESAALITDAGTPGISDPAWSLVTRCIDAGVTISPIPGASAVLVGLVGSGLPMDKFLYLGFLPLKKGRQTLFKSLTEEKRTVVFYESPKRIIKTLGQLNDVLGPETRVTVARELTKIHEEYIRGTIEEVLEDLESRPSIKGEIVVILKND